MLAKTDREKKIATRNQEKRQKYGILTTEMNRKIHKTEKMQNNEQLNGTKFIDRNITTENGVKTNYLVHEI